MPPRRSHMSLYLYTQIVRSLGIEEPDSPPALGGVVEGLASWFDVSGLAEASIAAATVQVGAISGIAPRSIYVDRRLCGLWFGWSLRPQGWVMRLRATIKLVMAGSVSTPMRLCIARPRSGFWEP